MTGPQTAKRVRLSKTDRTVERVEQGCLRAERSEAGFCCEVAARYRAFAYARSVFTRTKHGADASCVTWSARGIEATAIHGNKLPSRSAERASLAVATANPACLALTETLPPPALMIEGVSQRHHHFELPNVPEDYVHRIAEPRRPVPPGSRSRICQRMGSGLSARHRES